MRVTNYCDKRASDLFENFFNAKFYRLHYLL